MLSTLFVSFLYVALIAFGWFPCCCGLANNCCPGIQLPEILRGTFTSTCACVDGKVLPFVWDAVNARWEGKSQLDAVFNCGVATESYFFRLSCGGGFWGLTYLSAISGSGTDTACDFVVTATPDTESCDPFVMTFVGTMANVAGFSGGCPCHGESWTLTITR